MNTYLGKRDCINKKLPPSFGNSVSIADRKYGDRYERKFKAMIEGWCMCPFDDGKTGWEQIDFKNKENKIAIELKRRRIKKFQYEDILISYSKYEAARKLMRKGYVVYFFWKFIDELCFWKVPVILPKYCRIDDGGTMRRGFREISKCLYIPMSELYNWKDFPSYSDFLDQNEIVNK